jgi:phosphatidylglycerol---prolipoprotein diacylglyceryl transferase
VHPQLFQFGRLVLPTYGFLVAVGTILSLLLSVRTARLLSLNPDRVWNVAVLAVVSGLIGGKILQLALPWARRGGSIGWAWMAIAVLTGVVYATRLGLPLRRTGDAFAPSLALQSSVASIACLEAGCDYGAPTRLPWAVTFRSQAIVTGAPLGVPLHPAQLYAGVVEFVLFVLLLWLLHRPHDDGEILGTWLFLGGLSSFLLTSLRGDSILATQLAGALMVLWGGWLWLRRSPSPQVSHGG